MSMESKIKHQSVPSKSLDKPGASVPTNGQRRANANASKLGLSFTHTIAAMMRDAQYRNLRISELEWLVMPPLLVGQCRFAHTSATERGPFVPTAVALWASVSASVDKRLSENLDRSPKLSAAEWTSGNIKWLIAVAGDKRVLPKFLQQLKQSDFKGQTVKIRTRDSTGKPVVRTL